MEVHKYAGMEIQFCAGKVRIIRETALTDADVEIYGGLLGEIVVVPLTPFKRDIEVTGPMKSPTKRKSLRIMRRKKEGEFRYET